MATSDITFKIVNRSEWKVKVLSAVVWFLNQFQAKTNKEVITINITINVD